jgi:hypothetical protein
LGTLGALGIFIWQIYEYLRSGEWRPVSVITALRWCNIEWSNFPAQWIGVHKILDQVPLSFVSLIVGFTGLGAGLWWNKSLIGKNIRKSKFEKSKEKRKTLGY